MNAAPRRAASFRRVMTAKPIDRCPVHLIVGRDGEDVGKIILPSPKEIEPTRYKLCKLPPLDGVGCEFGLLANQNKLQRLMGR